MHPESSFLLSFLVFSELRCIPNQILRGNYVMRSKIIYAAIPFLIIHSVPLWLLPKHFLNYTKMQSGFSYKTSSTILFLFYLCLFFFFFPLVMLNIILFISIPLVPVIIKIMGHISEFSLNQLVQKLHL